MSVRRARAGVLGAFIALGACDGDRPDVGQVAWTTTVDSTGDTVVVRISGEVPASQVRRLVPELEVGAEEGAEEETFGEVGNVLASLDGGLIVHDIGAPAVRVFDPTGTFVRTIGGKGAGPGEYQWVNGIVRLPDGRLALWDATGSRFNLYVGDSAFQRSWRADFSRTFGHRLVWGDDSGDLFAYAVLARDPADPRRREEGVVRVDSSGQVRDSIPYLSWQEDPKPAQASSADGGSNMTWGIPFGGGNQTRRMRNGGVVSGFGDPYVFYILSPGSKPLRVEREHAPVPVSETEARERRAAIEFHLRRVDPAWTWSGTPFPSVKAAYEDLAVGGDGRIWVAVSMPDQPIPAGDIPPPAKDAPPPFTTRAPRVYDVYSPEGRLLGRIALPPRLELHGMRGDQVWGVRRDSLDVEYAVRMRIEPGLPAR
jgi:hypothetical protein